MRFLAVIFAVVFTVQLTPAQAGRLGVCYECKADGIPTPYYRWSGGGPFPSQCGALSGSKKRAPAQLCDAAEGIARYSPTNDPFWKCTTGKSNHTAWIGGETRDLAPIIHDGYRICSGRAGLAVLTAVFGGGFSERLGVEVRGSSGGTCRLDQGPWAAMPPATETRALR